MRAFLLCSATLSSALILASCDGKPEPRNTTAEETTAINQIVGQVSVLKKIAADPKDAKNILAAVDFEPYKTLISPLRRGTLRSSEVAPIPDCATTTMNSATLTNCELSADGTSHTVNGTVSYANDKVAADVSDSFSGKQTGTASVKADVTFSATLIDGSIKVEASLGGGDTTVSAAVTFAKITFDSAQCPTGGSLTLGGKVKVKGQEVSTTIVIDFGPACGDVTKG